MDDLIRRQDAIDTCMKYNGEGYMWSVIMADIKNLPSAQPDRKRGEWVGAHAYCNHLNEEAKANGKTELYMPSGMVIGVYCNQCWCRAERRSNFCPSCGADMRGEQDG